LCVVLELLLLDGLPEVTASSALSSRMSGELWPRVPRDLSDLGVPGDVATPCLILDSTLPAS